VQKKKKGRREREISQIWIPLPAHQLVLRAQQQQMLLLLLSRRCLRFCGRLCLRNFQVGGGVFKAPIELALKG
jgi:hypothetical protein